MDLFLKYRANKNPPMEPPSPILHRMLSATDSSTSSIMAGTLVICGIYRYTLLFRDMRVDGKAKARRSPAGSASLI